MPAKAIMMAVKFLGTAAGQVFLNKLKSGDRRTAEILLQGFGYAKPSPQSIADMIDLASSYDQVNNMNPDDVAKKIRSIMIGSPVDYLIRGAGAAASETANFIGNKAVNDANQLAAAILEGNRVNSARQNEIYGPSKLEQAHHKTASEMVRRGNNVKFATDAIGNFIDKTFGNYIKQDDSARAMQAAAYLNAPGSLYNYLNGMQSRASRVGGKK